MTSFSARAIAAALRITRYKNRVFNPERFCGPKAKPRKSGAYLPPRKLSRRCEVIEDEFRGWVVYRVVPRGERRSERILFLHGGGYAVEIQSAHWKLVGNLALGTRRTVIVPVYPLTPEHCHRDVLPVLAEMYSSLASEGDAISVVGDSAGAGMALALIHNLSPTATAPSDLVLFSPWVDAAMQNPAIAGYASSDPMLNPEHLRILGKFYAGPDDPTNPDVSPINKPLNYAGRILVFTGTRDVLHPDARRFCDQAVGQSLNIDYQEYEDMIHDWVLMPSPESRNALSYAVNALNAGSDPASPPVVR